MTVLTNADVKKLSFIKKVDTEGNVALVACPSNFRIGTEAQQSHLTAPSQPSFLVYKSVNQSFPSNIWTSVSWDTNEFNTGNNFSLLNAGLFQSGSFTAPVVGNYFFAASARVDVISNFGTQYSWCRMRNVTRGINYRSGLYEVDSQTVDYWTVQQTIIMNLAVGDQVDFQVYIRQGTTQHIEVGGNPQVDRYNYFSGYLLG